MAQKFAEVVHVADGRAGCDGHLDLAEVLLGFSEKFFCFGVIGGRLVFLDEGLGIWNEVEVVEVLLALAGELD
jgi:hypothetical protein